MKSKLELNKHNNVFPATHEIGLEGAGSRDTRNFTIFMAGSVGNNTDRSLDEETAF
jgi:hypothetical protein